jgi:hypothetical protein
MTRAGLLSHAVVEHDSTTGAMARTTGCLLCSTPSEGPSLGTTTSGAPTEGLCDASLSQLEGEEYGLSYRGPEVLGASMRLVKEGRHEGERGRGRNEGEGSIERTVLFLLQSLPLSMIGHPNIAGVLLSVVRVASHIGTSCPHYYNIGRLVLQPLPIGTRYPRTSIPPPLPGLLLAP